jgi:outer membrane protein assembly factor BamB
VVPNLPGSPTNVQRLANGNTFIALYNSALVGGLVMEVDREGKTVASIPVGRGPPAQNNALLANDGLLIAAHKTTDGHLLLLFTTGACVRVDASLREIKRYQVPGVNVGGVFSREGNLDVTRNGHLIVVQNSNSVFEYDVDGKNVWRAHLPGTRASRLLNENTLVASESAGVIELDMQGKVVWQYQPPAGYRALRARQGGDGSLGVPR